MKHLPEDFFPLDSLPDMIYVTTQEGTFVTINGTGALLLGVRDPEELVGRNIAEFYENSEDRMFYTSLMKSQGHVKNLEILLRRSDGTRIVVLDTSVVHRAAESGPEFYYGSIKEITERIQIENEQLRLSVELTEANRKFLAAQSRLIQQERLASIGQLAAGVAHEINNPLSFVRSNFGTLEEYISEISRFIDDLKGVLFRTERGDMMQELLQTHHLPTILEDSKAIFSESTEGFDRMMSIVRELRTFARSEDSRMETAFDINEAIEGAITMTRNEWKYVATIHRELGTLPQIQCASHGISQVVLNLMLNAVQALRIDHRNREKVVSIRSWAEENWVCFEVADNAEGIPEQHHGRIFDPFFTTKPAGQGTGLGLSISYDIIVNQHGGDLSFETSDGEGTRFLVRLPRIQRSRFPEG